MQSCPSSIQGMLWGSEKITGVRSTLESKAECIRRTVDQVTVVFPKCTSLYTTLELYKPDFSQPPHCSCSLCQARNHGLFPSLLSAETHYCRQWQHPQGAMQKFSQGSSVSLSTPPAESPNTTSQAAGQPTNALAANWHTGLMSAPVTGSTVRVHWPHTLSDQWQHL